MLQSIYDCIVSSLLWYKLFTKIIVTHGFKINLYDHCMENKTINGKKYTIDFYVDNNKIGHKHTKVVTSIIDTLK